jgi:hypothetical protein
METLNNKHNRLHKELQSKAKKLSWYYKLSDHEKQEAINNAMLKLLEKEKEGILNLDNQEEYMGYLFITLKNAIGRFFQSRKTIASKAIQYSREVAESDAVSNDEINQLDLSKLSQINRAIFRWYMRGWTILYLSKAIGIPESTIGYKLKRIKIGLKKQI